MAAASSHVSESFSARLAAQVRRKGTPAMVGLDPRWDSLPDAIRQLATTHTSTRLAAVGQAYSDFCRSVIDVVAPLVPIVKFQAAFFEAAGLPGMQALYTCLEHARSADVMVIVDGKRNDIGSTAAAYAQAYLEASDNAAWPADALTVSPYPGLEGIEPFARQAAASHTSIFVLVRTSNPGAGELQDAAIGERTVYQLIADWVEQFAVETKIEDGTAYGPIGAVVGATVPTQLFELRARMPHCWLLVPGYGAQGGTSADVAGAFDHHGLGAVVNNSRGIIFAHQSAKYSGLSWREAVNQATQTMIDDLAKHTPAGLLR